MQRSREQTPLEESESGEQDRHFQSSESKNNPWDLAIEIMLAPLLLFMPMALGTSDARSELVVFVVVTAMCLCLIGKLMFQRGARFLWSWSYLPMAIFLAVAGAQLLPLPARLVHVISPQTFEIKKDLLSDAPNAGPSLSRMTLSFYPPGTRHDLRIVLTAAAIMIVVANTFRTPRQIRRLLMEVCAVGAIVGVVALLQDFYQMDAIFGVYKLAGSARATGGPFVDRSHFAQFMNLSIGFAISLLLVRLQEIFPRGDISPARLARPWIDHEVWGVWLAIAAIVIGATSVCLCMSRAGLVSMIAAGVAIGVAIGFSGNSKGRGSILTLLALIVFASVLYLGFDSITERFATARDVATAGGRLQVVKDLRVVWKKFPILGSGLGTHQAFFPMFDTSTTATQPDYVEVEFAQLMEEMGAVGVALVAIFIVILAVAFVRGVRRKHPIHGAALGLAFGLGAVFLHSFTDFGQHFLPDAGLSAISCGLILALSRSMRAVSTEETESRSENRSQRSPTPGLLNRPSGLAVAIMLGLLMALSLPDAISAKRAAFHANIADSQAAWLASKNWSGDNQAFADLINEADLASNLRPDDVTYRYVLNRYRWLAICRTADGDQTVEPDADDEWMGFARRIDNELQACRVLCPTYGPPLALAGQIEYFYLDKSNGIDHIRLGAKLSPHQALTCFIAGELEAVKGNRAEALQYLTRAFKVDGTLDEPAIKFCLDHQHDPDLAVQLAQDQPYWLLYVADALDHRKIASDLSEKCRDQAFAKLKISTLQVDATSSDLGMLAGLYFDRHEYQAAADLYHRALQLQYSQPLWHLRLARCLLEAGNLADANHEAWASVRLGGAREDADPILDRTRDFSETRPATITPSPATTSASPPTTSPTTRSVSRPTTSASQ